MTTQRLSLQRVLLASAVLLWAAPLLGVTCWAQVVASGPQVDVMVSRNVSTASTTNTSPTVTTTGSNELLVAFIAADNPGLTCPSTPQSVTGVTSSPALTWTQAVQNHSQCGAAAIFWAYRATSFSGTVEAHLAKSADSLMTVIAFTGTAVGADSIGNVKACNAPPNSGAAPQCTLITTRTNSWVFAVGNDWDKSRTMVPGPNQMLRHSYDAPVRDTYWVQSTTAPTTTAAPTMVTINDSYPTPNNDRWDFSLIEIRTPGHFIAIPTSSPGAITAGVQTVVTVSSFITNDPSGLGAPNTVNLEQVDSSGNLIAVLGPLNDNGVNGDLYAGDQIFSSKITFNVAAPGTVWLRVSAAFAGLSNPARSDKVPLEILPQGAPIGSVHLSNSQIVTDTSDRQMLCNQVLADFQPGTSFASINSAVSGIGGQVIGFLSGVQVHTWQIQIPCNGSQGVLNAINTLLANPIVVAAKPNTVFTVSRGIPNDPKFFCALNGTCSGNFSGDTDFYQLTAVGADKAWGITTGLSPNLQVPPPIIAVLDSGVDYTHEDLASPGKVLKGHNFIAGNDDPMDDCGHGTSIAGIAAADSNNGIGITGVSWASPVLAEKSVDSTCSLSVSDTQSAMSDAIAKGAKIINMSMGSKSGNNTTSAISDWGDMIQMAQQAGRLVVASAGNDFCSGLAYPAAFTTVPLNVISVGGMDLGTFNVDGMQLPGNTPCGAGSNGSNFGPWVDIYAPYLAYATSAHHVTETNQILNPGGYDFRFGTSFSAPFVSGAAALVWAANPQLSAADVKNALLTGAVNGGLDPNGASIKVLNVFNAVLLGAAQHCTACPQAPEVTLAAYGTASQSSFQVENGTGVIETVGTVRAATDKQNISVHGVSIPLAPISNGTGAPIYAPNYEVLLTYAVSSWDSYAPGAWFDSFSVSTSTAPYWEMGVQDPIWGQWPFLHVQTTCPLASGFVPPACPFFATFLTGSLSQGNLFSQTGFLDPLFLAGAPYLTGTGPQSFTPSPIWLNVVLDTATLPDANNLLPSWGTFAIGDITPVCHINNPGVCP